MKALIKDYLHNALVLGKIDKAESFLHPRFTSQNPLMENRLTLQSHMKMVKLILMAFENIHLEWKDCVVDDVSNKLFINYVFKAVHVRDILDYKARHNVIHLDIGALYRFSQDKIFYEKTFFDVYSLIHQIKK